MKSIIIILLIFSAYFAVFAQFAGIGGCGPGAEYNECGTSCPLTCENYLKPPQVCITLCLAGCQCVPGYVKLNQNSEQCVRKQDCRKDSKPDGCGSGAVYNECGTSCPITCENYRRPPQNCQPVCRAGCECIPGLVKLHNNSDVCVRREHCRTDIIVDGCGAGSVYNQCGTLCPITCQNYRRPPQNCSTACNSGCQCLSGLVKLNHTSDACVKIKDCRPGFYLSIDFKLHLSRV